MSMRQVILDKFHWWAGRDEEVTNWQSIALLVIELLCEATCETRFDKSSEGSSEKSQTDVSPDDGNPTPCGGRAFKIWKEDETER